MPSHVFLIKFNLILSKFFKFSKEYLKGFKLSWLFYIKSNSSIVRLGVPKNAPLNGSNESTKLPLKIYILYFIINILNFTNLFKFN